MGNLENLISNYAVKIATQDSDPSHDLLHLKRVVQWARKLALQENANLNVVIPAAYLIEAHSFSANIVPTTIEAKIVQDADRLDALGAIGIARCFSVAGRLSRSFYNEEEPIVISRSLDDQNYTLDHFFVKLLKIPHTLHTESAKKEAAQRLEFMKAFVDQFSLELRA